MLYTILNTLNVWIHFPFYKWRNRGQVTCPESQSKLTTELGLNIKKFGSKALVLNDHDTLPPKHKLYLYSLIANKMIKEKQK